MNKLIVLLLLALLAAPAVAQDKTADKPKTPKRAEKEKEKFYDFDNLLIDGELKAPNAFFSSARQRVRWGRLLRLRKSFVPDLMSTDKAPVLREGSEK